MVRRKKAYLTEIQWDDHSEDAGWERPSDIDISPIKITSVGWVIKEDGRSLALAGAFSSAGYIGNRQYILKSCITKRKRLRHG